MAIRAVSRSHLMRREHGLQDEATAEMNQVSLNPIRLFKNLLTPLHGFEGLGVCLLKSDRLGKNNVEADL